MKRSKKAFVGDVIVGTTQLFIFFIVLAICIYLIFQFNDAAQGMDQLPAEAKAESQAYVDQYPTMMGWLFTAAFIGLFIYTLITAFLIEVISKVWFVIGFIIAVIQGIYSGIIMHIFEAFAATAVFGFSLAYIPGAIWYFNNLILANGIWAFMILLALYFKK